MNSNDTSEKTRRWLLPELTKSKLSPGLYLVATPIGNLRDITVRALDTLDQADVILCEDTRVSGKLLSAYGIKGKKLMVYNDHASDALKDQVCDMISGGQAVALISDAGTPLIADPGYKLVRQCYQQGLTVTPLPGANAALSALQLSSFPSDSFCFIGFLPAKMKARQDYLAQWSNVNSSLIAYETAPRLEAALADIQATLGGRKVAVIREVTKLYEQVRIDNLSALIDHYNEHGKPKGEIVLVIEPPAAQDWGEQAVIDALTDALKDHPTKKAASLIAEQSGWAKKAVYDLALKVKNA